MAAGFVVEGMVEVPLQLGLAFLHSVGTLAHTFLHTSMQITEFQVSDTAPSVLCYP
jgi:hypothetical protein